MSTSARPTGLIAWFAANRVAANLLMWLLIGAGIASAFTIRMQTTPDMALNVIDISVVYPGAAPQEVESGVIVKIEEAIQDVQGIDEIRSIAREGLGTVSAEVLAEDELSRVLDDIKSRVGAIASFPGDIEPPVIKQQQQPFPVIFLALHGDQDERTRKDVAQSLREALLRLPEVTQVDVLGARDYEIGIEVSEHTLREYGLSMTEVAEAVRSSSLDLPGGAIQSSRGDILLRSQGQAHTGADFSRIVLRSLPDGTRISLGEVAEIRDGFVEEEAFGRFDGQATTTLRIMAAGQQNELATAKAVREFVAQRAATLPPGLQADLWIDRSHYLKDRLGMMLKNMLQGALLVFVVLSLFLQRKIAWWVIMGIPATFFGALWLLPLVPSPVTINTISLFGFIIVLGIVVDDAIVVGESVHEEVARSGHSLRSVIRGAERVALPATFGVLTTVAAFGPLLFVGGVFAPYFEALSTVVILCLLLSLLESKLILPAHLAGIRFKSEDLPAEDRQRSVLGLRFAARLAGLQQSIQRQLERLIRHGYRPLLAWAVANRGVTTAIFVALLIIAVGLLQSNLVRVVLIPEVPSDFIQVQLQMEPGTAAAARNETVRRIEQTLLQMNEDYVRSHPDSLPMIAHVGVFTSGDSGAMLLVEMPLDEARPFEGVEISDQWRERVGALPGVSELSFSGATPIGGGKPLSFRLSGPDYAELVDAAEMLERALTGIDGVYEVANSSVSGAEEIQIRLKPLAESLGLSHAALAQQVRQAFHGEEAQRIQRDNEEIKVLVRYPRAERQSIHHLQNMRVRTAQGDEVPFESVAELEFGQSYSNIQRLDRIRTVTVAANVHAEVVEPSVVIDRLKQTVVPNLLAQHPGVRFGLEGSSEDERELLERLIVAAVAAVLLIYALIAVPLRSYLQPLIIMSVIPFGLIGAVVGHLLMGQPLSMFSLFGIIALSGIVVNDSLVLLDFVNRARENGQPLLQAVIDSGTQRFRAILLTSFTTVAGLFPMLFETSVQAQFVIPMAISVSFGIVFATAITLILVPALCALELDFGRGAVEVEGDPDMARL
ncbi:MAG: efflux RND transporter permease subunit [Xanthomonadales bacterium]|nr:efflux RND transporter permease subunit [Xanthomonadales bacterium]